MTIANRITLIRAALAIMMFGFILMPNLTCRIIALLLLGIAGISDCIDGIIARRTSSITQFGTIADPFVDKILVLAAFMAFATTKELNVPAWAVFLILVRELMVSNLRVLAALNGEVMSADRWGKCKTGVQISATFLILAILTVKTWAKNNAAQNYFVEFIDRTSNDVTYALSVLAAAVTMASGVAYLYRHKSLLENSWSVKK